MNERWKTPSSGRALLVAALSLVSFSTSATPAASADQAVFSADTSVVEADPNLLWSISLHLENRLPHGIYLDSLTCEVQDLDPGVTRDERVSVLVATHIVEGNSVSAGESFDFTYSAPASAERAHLTLRITFHGPDKSRTSLTIALEAMPGPTSRDHPSQFLTVGGKRVEYVLFPGKGDSLPGLLVVHPWGSHARQMMRNALRIVPRGYTVMLVSMPGYGQSDGPPDYVGPATLQALSAALDQLRATPGVDRERIAAWGISRGAASVALLAQRRPDLRAVVTESGTYDFWAMYRAADAERREVIVKEVGRDSSAWRERSAALQKGNPTAILILHGEKDVLAPAQQAHGFVESLKARGAEVESRFFPNSGHGLPLSEVLRTMYDFLGRRFR